MKYIYITNRQEIAAIAQGAGVDRICVDMEYIGKAQRQIGMNTALNRHSFGDVASIRRVIDRSELLVRVNPIHDTQEDGYPASEEEIDRVIKAGADIVMLPYYKTEAEASRFLEAVNGRAKAVLLLETAEAAKMIDTAGVTNAADEIHIGLNDLSLSYHERFLFEPMNDGTVERICEKLRCHGKTYGIGGIASPGRGLVPAEIVLREHYRLGSTGAILSRSFCNIQTIGDLAVIEELFSRAMRGLRALEAECEQRLREQGPEGSYFMKNKEALALAVRQVLSEMDR